MDQNQDWKNKKARIEILRDNNKLIFTASDILIENNVISFTDRTGARFGFPTSMIQQIQEITNGGI